MIIYGATGLILLTILGSTAFGIVGLGFIALLGLIGGILFVLSALAKLAFDETATFGIDDPDLESRSNASVSQIPADQSETVWESHSAKSA